MNAGDVYSVDLEPTRGREQQGRRPVLILSAAIFNKHNPPLVAPITSGGAAARYGNMAISLTGTGCQTAGVVLCNQIRTLDVRERGGKRVESVPDYLLDDVKTRIADIFGFGGDL